MMTDNTNTVCFTGALPETPSLMSTIYGHETCRFELVVECGNQATVRPVIKAYSDLAIKACRLPKQAKVHIEGYYMDVEKTTKHGHVYKEGFFIAERIYYGRLRGKHWEWQNICQEQMQFTPSP
ncbi:MAG: hypothetical protein LBS36_13620 [Oscillospiraceae bacterium]|jgi:hypothetical protein|nr:hypothetical protein [Oscillospiraceae bacterium]